MLQRFSTILRWMLAVVVAVVAVPLAGAQPTTAGGANPAQTLLGQAATICAGGASFQVEVTSAEWLRTAGGRAATGNAMWAIVYFEITNLSATEAAPYQGNTAALQLVDERGRASSGDVGPTLASLQRGLAASGGRLPFTDPVPAGTQDSRVLAFEAPADAQRLTIASQLPCTAGGANPTEALLGQAATICAGGSRFQVEVTGADWTRTVDGRTAAGNAMWAIVYFEITNLSATEAAPYQGDTAALQLVDERGRASRGDVGPVLATVQRSLAASAGRLPFTDPVPPGTQDSRVIAFEAPPDAQRLTIASQFPC